MRKISCALAALLTLTAQAFAGVPTDFDGDGVSDLTRVEKESDNSLTWKAQLSGSNQSTTLGSLGTFGNHITMAQWLGSGTQIGVVAVDQASGNLVWSILDSSNAKIEKTFGKAGDLVVAGADFNGNGTADAAVVRLKKGKAVWEIAFDLFASPNPELQTFKFGKTGDRAFFAKVEGGAIDWVGVLGKGRKARSAARMKNMVTGEIKTFSRLPKFASQGARPRAFPISQGVGADLLGFQVVKGGDTQILVYTLTGTKMLSKPLTGAGETLVGDFSAGGGYEVAFQGESTNVIIDPVSAAVQDGENLGGVAVDEINVNTVGAAVAPTPTPDGSGDSGSNGGGAIAACSSIVSWPSGHIYKTVGSEHFSDIRRNTIGIVVKVGGRGPFPSCVKAVDTQGNIVAQLGLYSRGAGWAARYYAGVGCGAGTPFNGSAVASRARSKTGSSRIYMNFGGTCYGPIEASACVGSKQC